MPRNIIAALLLCTHTIALLVGVLIGSVNAAAMRRDPGGLRFVLIAGLLLVMVAAVILATRG